MLKTLFKIAISVLLIWWLLSQSDMDRVFERMAGVGLWGMVTAFVMLVVLAAVQAARWRLVVLAIDGFIHLKDAILNVLIGLFFNQVLPSSIGGDAVRIWRAYRLGLSVVAAAHSVMLDRLTALLALILMAGAGMPLIHAYFGNSAQLWAVVLLVVGGLAAFAVLFGLDRIPGKFLANRLMRALARLSGDARTVMLHPASAVPVLAISVLIHIGVSLTVFVIAKAMGLAIGAVDCLILVPPVILFSMIPVSIAGWGMRESAMVTAFGFVGVGNDEALALSVLFGLAMMASGLPGGVIWLLYGSQREAGKTADL